MCTVTEQSNKTTKYSKYCFLKLKINKDRGNNIFCPHTLKGMFLLFNRHSRFMLTEHTCLSHLSKKWFSSWWLFPVFKRLMAPPGGYKKIPQIEEARFGCSAASASLGGQRFSSEREKSIMFPLYFSREEKALTFAVGCRDALQLKEVEEDLNLSHDLQGPAVIHRDWLGAG